MQPITDFSSIFLNDTAMMDVRAPVEYLQGSFPHSVNLPLMTDDEREAVGTRYKEQGQEAAIELGHELVTGGTKNQRVEAWRAFHEANPSGILYCFRGGLRSKVTQQWLSEAGIDVTFVEGGYKAMRRFLLDNLHTRVKDKNILILGGATGSGKTEVINQWRHSIDLEGLANHRGSAFGRTHEPQPAQIDFENAWSIEWLKHHNQNPMQKLLFEDESRLIGRVAVLPEFLAAGKLSSNVAVEVPLSERIARIRKDYFENTFRHFEEIDGADEYFELSDYIADALDRIKKRLGGERHQTLITTLNSAMAALKSQNSWDQFDDIITVLLVDYYDPMYNYQQDKKAERTIFKGNHQEILEWLESTQIA